MICELEILNTKYTLLLITTHRQKGMRHFVELHSMLP